MCQYTLHYMCLSCCHAMASLQVIYKYIYLYIYICFFCINMNILRVNMGWSGNMWRDTASKEAPRGEKPALVWQYLCLCGVRAEAQRPRCIQGKCDWGREAAPAPPWCKGMFYLSGAPKQAVCLTWKPPQQQLKERCVAPVHLHACWACGTFALNIIW